MLKRRDFLRSGAAAAAVLLSRNRLVVARADDEQSAFRFTSEHMELQLSATAPEFLSLNVDGLGQGRRGTNIFNGNKNWGGYKASSSLSGKVRRIEYRAAEASERSPAGWVFEFSGNRIVLTSEWCGEFDPPALVLPFNLSQVHSTVLGLFSKDGLLATPALLHFPGQGSMRAFFKSDGCRESYRQNSAVLTEQILPLQPHLVAGDFSTLTARCLLPRMKFMRRSGNGASRRNEAPRAGRR